MKLTGKLFLSYLAVVVVCLLILALSAAYVAPEEFSHRMGMMETPFGQGTGQRGMMQQHQETLDEETEEHFQQSVNEALFRAGIAATLTAIVISLFISRRIVKPIRALAQGSQRIADGHYDERLDVPGKDELGELVMHFNLMAEALEETETMRQQLMGDVTHELKTPLASIQGYMEGLQDGLIPATPETYQLIHQEADRLQRLVLDLQELSRTEAGQIAIDPQPCHANELLWTAIERMRPQFEDKGIRFETHIPGDLPPVRADVDRSVQVLTNLLGNALQYTPSGGEVVVGVNWESDYLQVSIRDNGVGLSIEDTKRVFQRFYRVDKSRSRKSGGSGIGLTIARHLVEAQGGTIWAESAGLGEGSTFRFTLPLA